MGGYLDDGNWTDVSALLDAYFREKMDARFENEEYYQLYTSLYNNLSSTYRLLRLSLKYKQGTDCYDCL